MWMKIGLLAIAGAVGTLARYWLNNFVYWLCGEGFPWWTLVVNVLGCFLFGLVWTLAEERALISGETRLIILTGFMGAFTTFSTYAFETSDRIRLGLWLSALGNFAAQNVLGIFGVFLGWAVGRLL